MYELIRITVLAVLVMAPLTCPAQERRSQSGIFGAGQPAEMAAVRKEVKSLGISNFQLQSRQVDGRLAIDSFTGTLGGGTIAGQGLIDWSRQNDTHHLTLQITNVEAEALLKAFSIKLDARISSTVSGVLQLQWQGLRGSNPRATMNGSVNLQFSAGRIYNADVLNGLAQVTGIAQIQQIEISGALLAGNISDGIMSVSRADISGPYTQATGTGAFDLRTEEIKLRFAPDVTPSLLQLSQRPEIRALGTLAGKSGFRPLPMQIRMFGTIRNPRFDYSLPQG